MQRVDNNHDLGEFVFQSMHPIKDATNFQMPDTTFFRISIHAPYKGCNPPGVHCALCIVQFLFQSMHPIKDATTSSNLYARSISISIHAPYKGCNDFLNY